MSKTHILLAFGVLPAALFAQDVRAGSGGYGSDSPFSTGYNVNRQVIFSGTVVGKSTFIPQAGMTEAEQILVKSGKSIYGVALGPAWYVNNQAIHVYVGEHVRVIGSPATTFHTPVVLAKQVINTDNKHVLALRDLNGAPYWVAARENAPAPATNAPAVSGTVTKLTTININGVPYQAYVLQNEDGTVNVLTGPSWYMNQQDVSIPLGAHLNVIAGSGPVSLGNGTIIANSLGWGSSTITLQNNGLPVWSGFQPLIVR